MKVLEIGNVADVLGTVALLGAATLFLLPWLWEKLIPSLTYALSAILAILLPLYLIAVAIAALLTGSPYLSRLLLVAAAVTEPISVTGLAVIGFMILNKEQHSQAKTNSGSKIGNDDVDY